MAYRIVYADSSDRPKKEKFWSRRMTGMTALFFALFMLSVKLLWKDGGDLLREILLPGNGENTVKALEELISQLHEGAAFGDAVTAFCREIIAGAGIG